jgi:hypothetical protein
MGRNACCMLVAALLCGAGFAACCKSGDSATPDKPAESATTTAPAVNTPDAAATVRVVTTTTASVSAWFPTGSTPFGSGSVGGIAPPHGTTTGTTTATVPPATTGTSTAFGHPPPIVTSKK